jgi:2-keto-4-pentenoate hydratase/2-oxohepta-3-ene-1,7-dioic acid hydratase in catechol pathway
MKLASYLADGAETFGVVRDDGVITMNHLFGARAASLRDALAADMLPQIREAASHARPDRKLADITFLPVIPNPDKIACAGINYRSHAAKPGVRFPSSRACSCGSPIR